MVTCTRLFGLFHLVPLAPEKLVAFPLNVKSCPVDWLCQLERGERRKCSFQATGQQKRPEG